MTKYRKPGSRPSKPVNPAEQEDAFVARTLEVSNWAQRNRPTLTAGVILVALGVVALVYYARYREDLGDTAAARLEDLQLRLDAGDQAGVQADLQVYLERFGSTSSAGEARLTLGQVTADLGDLDAAVEVLEPIAGDVRDPLGAQAAALLAAISEDAGNLQMAEGLYERLAERARLGFVARDALADEARLRAGQGDYQAALDIYDRLLEEMGEGDPDRGIVEMRRAEMAVAVNRGGR